MNFKYKILLSAIAFSLVGGICKRVNREFDIDDLVKPTQEKALPSSFPIEDLLKQKFFFLGRGHQAHVFVSEDGEYVLKLFKPHYPRCQILGCSFRFTYLPFSKSLYNFFTKKEQEQRKLQDFKSYQNALNLFQKESLVEYLHLSQTHDIKTPLRFFDKIGIARTLNPNNTAFLIQKRATSLEEALKKLSQDNKRQEAKIILQNLVNLLSRRLELGFHLPTHKFHANFGLVENQPIQYDIGRLLTKEDLGISSLEEQPDIGDSLTKLKIWLEKEYPNFANLLDEIIF